MSCPCFGWSAGPRVGLLARAENRGLGIQTHEFFRHMNPTKTLLVDLGDASPYELHPERFPGSRTAFWHESNGWTIDDNLIEWLLEDIDVLFTAETFYDFRIVDIARARGITTVVQANHEFMRWLAEKRLPKPDLFIAPSTWNMDKWPAPKMYLPFPVCRHRLPFRQRTKAETFLHVVGHRAMLDRNGTRLLEDALLHVTQPIKLIVTSQMEWGQRGVPEKVEVELQSGDRENYWEPYAKADVLVMPRRYGGMSLVFNEAASSGMPIVALDVPPQDELLPRDGLVRAHLHRRALCQSGSLEVYACKPDVLAEKIDHLAGDDSLVRRLSAESGTLGAWLSWEALGPRYGATFEALAQGRDFFKNPLETVAP